jgi:3-hydroxybutyryl-CoA dehydrogenase
MDHSRIVHIAVVGAGLMGHGIAQEFSLAGYQVRLHDLTDDRLENAQTNIRDNLQRLASLGRLEHSRIEPAVAAITASTDLAKTVSGAELVIEAIVEELGAKHALLRSLNKMCDEDTIIASNTSSFMPSRLAEAVSRPDRLLVAHYFNPPYLIPLVEIVPGPHTSDETVVTLVGLLQKLDKKPVVLRKEATGFVGNRLQFALFREALAIVEQGVADPVAVDQVVRFGFGRRLAVAGPFEVFDLAGLDTILAVASQILPELDATLPKGPPAPELLSRKVAEGNFGVKSGRGFHEWTAKKADELRDRLTKALLQFDSIG